MRILLVIEPSGGGSGRHVADLARALVLDGHAVSLIYSPTRAEAQFEAEVQRLNLAHRAPLPLRRTPGPWDVAALGALRRLIRRLGPFDVIHGHSAKAGALARLAAPRGAARIYTPHALITLGGTGCRHAFYGLIEALLARMFSDAVIAVSEEEAAHARRWGFPPKRLHVVANGLGVKISRNRSEARAALGADETPWIVGFVGRLCPQKDPVRFAQAVRIAAAASPGLAGVVVGDGALFSVVAEAGGQAVKMMGARDARPLLAGFDLFVTTSRYEGLSYAMMEAAAAGLPILSTPVGGVSTLRAAGAAVHALPLDATPEQFAQAMIRLRDTSPPSPDGAAVAARLSARRMATETAAVYHSALAFRRGSRD